MKIPTEIRIGAHLIPVRILSKQVSEDVDYRGIWDGGKPEIKLVHELGGSMKQMVFIHECIEAMNDLFELELEHWKIMTLAEHLTGVFQQMEQGDQ